MSTSSASTLAAVDHETVTVNGIHLHVAKAGPTDGPLVILLHGFPEFWYGWRHQIEFLASQGYHVWAPDQRGYNLSEKPFGVDAYRISQLSGDVVGLIDAAGRDQAFVVGHDWGAAVAWYTALTAPERVCKLTILNVPHLKVMLEMVRTNPVQMLRSWYVGYFQIPALPEMALTAFDGLMGAQALFGSSRPGTFKDADIAQYVKAWNQPGAATGMLNWYRAIVQYPPHLPEDVRVHVPTLVIWGARDRFLSREMAQASVELCTDGRLVMIEEATHWVQHEEAGRVNALLAEHFGS